MHLFLACTILPVNKFFTDLEYYSFLKILYSIKSLQFFQIIYFDAQIFIIRTLYILQEMIKMVFDTTNIIFRKNLVSTQNAL